MFSELEKLYPAAIAFEKADREPALYGGGFTRGFDSGLSGSQTYFSACTEDGTIRIHLICENFVRDPAENVQVYFDPKHNGRKFHNGRAVSVGADGSAELFVYGYKLERRTEFEGFSCRTHWDGGSFVCNLAVPFGFLNSEQSPHCESLEYIGFNVFREGKESSKWAGIPTDLSYLGEEAGGQGNGILVFARNIKGDAEKASERFLKESVRNYAKWEKTFVPREIYGLMAEKRHGFTASIKKEDADRARRNAETTPWGSAMKDRILEVADYWVSRKDDDIFDMMVPANPHAMTPGQYYGDPISGGNRNAFRMCLERPYQYYNCVTGEWWYNGKEVANPGTGGKVVFRDDGPGFLAPEGFPHPNCLYMFTASYRYFLISVLLGLPYAPVLEDRSVCPETSGSRYYHAVTNLAYAYVLTGKKTYAYKALLILGRLAEIIPYMNGSHGDGTIGDMAKITESTTSEVFLYNNYFAALDLVYDAIDEVGNDLRSYFATKPDAEGNPRMEPFDVKRAAREFIPHVINLCEINKPVTHDSSVRWINLEMLLASFLESDRLMDRALYEGDFSFISKIRNCYYRDGRYAYDSMEYQKIITLEMMLYPNNVFHYRYRDGRDLNLFEETSVGLSRIIGLYFKLICGNLTSAFGDTSLDNGEPLGEMRRRGISAYTPAAEIAYRRAGDSPEGRALKKAICALMSVYEPEEIAALRLSSIAEKANPEEAEINKSLLLLAAAPDPGEYRKKAGSNRIQAPALLEDSQTSIFRSGSDAHDCKHVVLFAQPTAPHAHGDKLGLWIGAYGYHMMAGGGGYPYTWIAKKLYDWEWNSGNCMVVLIDGKTQRKSFSEVKSHYEGKKVQFADIRNFGAYPGCHYERACALISAPNGSDAYVFDLFYVSGGTVYDYNTSGIGLDYSKISFEGIAPGNWTEPGGTMAGAGTELYSDPGYYWMKMKKRARIEKSCEKVSWSFHFGRDAALKVHAFTDGGTESLLCALGEMGGYEQGKSPWEPYVFHRKETDRPCVFTTVLEPYEKGCFLKKISRLAVAGTAGKGRGADAFAPSGADLLYADGQTRDIVLSVHDGGETVTFRDESGKLFETDARFALLRYRENRLVHAEAVGYTYLRAEGILEDRKEEFSGSGCYTGRISQIDYESRRIAVEMDRDYHFDSGVPDGAVAVFSSPDYQKASSYYINRPVITGRNLSFTSDMSLILKANHWPRGEKDLGIEGKPVVNIKGTDFVVDLKTGDRVRIENDLVKNREEGDGRERP